MNMLNGSVELYVDESHTVGGVTAWSNAMVGYLGKRRAAGIVALRQGRRTCESVALPELRGARVVRPRPLRGNHAGKPRDVHYWTGRPVSPPSGGEIRIRQLDQSAQSALSRTAIYIPNYLEFGYQLAALSRLQGHPSRCIGICHTDEPHYYRLLHRYEPIIQKFVGVSTRTCRHLVEAIPHRVTDIHFIPYGVDCPEVYPDTHQTRTAIRLLYAGRLVSRQKRVFDFVDMVKSLERRQVEYQFDLIGTGPDVRALENSLNAVSARIRVLPPKSHPEMLRVYNRYDVFVMVSATEGTSIAMLEAMSQGVVPVVTEVSGSEDVVEHGVNGLLTPVGQPEKVAEHIASVAMDRTKLRTLSSASWSTIARSYRFDRQAEEFMRVVAEADQAPIASVQAARRVLYSAVR